MRRRLLSAQRREQEKAQHPTAPTLCVCTLAWMSLTDDVNLRGSVLEVIRDSMPNSNKSPGFTLYWCFVCRQVRSSASILQRTPQKWEQKEHPAVRVRARRGCVIVYAA